MRSTPQLLIGITAASLALLPACTAKVEVYKTVDKTKIEKAARQAMKEGTKVDLPVTCPDETIKEEVGSTVRCWWTDKKGATLGLTVTITKVQSDGTFSIHVSGDTQTTPAK